MQFGQAGRCREDEDSAVFVLNENIEAFHSCLALVEGGRSNIMVANFGDGRVHNKDIGRRTGVKECST